MTSKFAAAVGGAVALSVVLAAGPGRAQSAPWTSWTEADMRALLEMERGVVIATEQPAADRLEMTARIDDWFVIRVLGESCSGEGAAKRCEMLAFNALFEVNDEPRSLMLERELTLSYVADLADGGDILIHRTVELGGTGASPENIRAQLRGFVSAGDAVYWRIWPPQNEASPDVPGQPDGGAMDGDANEDGRAG